MTALCPDCFAKPNFTSALSDSSKHHIHNPDATHNQRNTSDCGKKNRERICYLRERAENIGLRQNREVGACRVNAMLVSEHNSRLLLDLGHKVFSFNAYRNR